MKHHQRMAMGLRQEQVSKRRAGADVGIDSAAAGPAGQPGTPLNRNKVHSAIKLTHLPARLASLLHRRACLQTLNTRVGAARRKKRWRRLVAAPGVCAAARRTHIRRSFWCRPPAVCCCHRSCVVADRQGSGFKSSAPPRPVSHPLDVVVLIGAAWACFIPFCLKRAWRTLHNQR